MDWTGLDLSIVLGRCTAAGPSPPCCVHAQWLARACHSDVHGLQLARLLLSPPDGCVCTQWLHKSTPSNFQTCAGQAPSGPDSSRSCLCLTVL